MSVKPYLEYLFAELANHADDTNSDFIAELLPWSKTVRKKCRIKKN
ncbi:MAG: hypothetical protein K6G81_06340 [Lachnospiraceae bacterium]|nr:hypothetical protein [Lachnospiraceae bacterium]